MEPALLMLIVFIVALAINVPVAYTFILAALAFVPFHSHLSFLNIMQRVIGGMNSFILLTVPFFILVGLVMNRGGITKKIFKFARALVGHIPGGLGHVNIVASIIFAGMSGSSQADAAGLGQIEIEGMSKEGYDLPFSAAVTAASSIIGPIIPPSISLVVYGSLAGVSIGAMLVAGLIPGLFLGLMLMLAVFLISKSRNYPKDKRADFSEVWAGFKESFFALLTPVILLGGIMSAVFTPSEAGAVAALYAIIISILIYKTLKWEDIPGILGEWVILNAGIMIIIGAASAMGWMLTWEGIPQSIANALLSTFDQTWIILILINIIFLIGGMFMEGLAMMTIFVPLMTPIVSFLGVDLIHFGVIVVFNALIGGLTPPVGVLAFILCTITDLTMEEYTKAILPFLLTLIVALLIITFVPQITMFLPNLIF